MEARLTRDEKREVTRERLLDSAAVVIAEQGYAGATLDEIAAHAGLTKGAVYSNFASKEELFFALMRRGLAADLEPLMDRSRPLVDRVVAFAREGARQSASKQAREYSKVELEFITLAQRDERARSLVREIHQRTRAALGRFLEDEAAREGTTLPFDGQTFATVLLATIRGLLQQRFFDPKVVRIDVIEEAVRLLFAAPRRASRGT